MSAVHIAGNPCTIDGRRRQLCAWCGEVLLDDDSESTMVPDGPDGEPGPEMSSFIPGSLVRVIEGNPRAVVIVVAAPGVFPIGGCEVPPQ